MQNCDLHRIIKKSPVFEIEKHGPEGTTSNIIDVILEADTLSSEFVLPGVTCLYGATLEETLYNVWAFVKYNVRYQPDRPGHEKVKSPGALFTLGVGDCKSFSIALGAILRALGVPYKYRFTAYEPGDVTHVYIVAMTGEGNYILDSVHTAFNDEHPYFKKKDIKPRVAVAVNGLPDSGGLSSPVVLLCAAAAFGGLLYFISQNQTASDEQN